MHSSGNVDDISSDTDTSGGARIGAFVYTAGMCTTGDIMEEWPVHHHLYMCVADPQQLPNPKLC